MKEIWQRPGFRKTDEMERYIIAKAQRNAYLFLIIALLFCSLYESYKVFVYHSSLNLLPCFLLVAASLIQTFTQLILTRNAVKDDVDSAETEPLFKIIILVCAIAALAATAIAAILLMGVRV